MIDAHKLIDSIQFNMIWCFIGVTFFLREDILSDIQEIFRSGQSMSYRVHIFTKLTLLYGIATAVVTATTTAGALLWALLPFDINITIKGN